MHVAAKKDSTGICFIGERPFKDFLSRYLPPKQGEIRRLDDGKVIGEHDGSMFHTFASGGQHIGGLKKRHILAVAIIEVCLSRARIWKNVLYVVQGHDHPALLKASLDAEQLSWISGQFAATHWVYTAKPRYRTVDQPCEVERVDAESCTINFAELQWALTPRTGCSHESRVCLGGGVIR